MNKELQHEDSAKVTLSFIRACFTGLIDKYPDLASDLTSDADTVHCKDFENAIVKVQRGKETTLTQQEKRSVTHLLRPQTRR